MEKLVQAYFTENQPHVHTYKYKATPIASHRIKINSVSLSPHLTRGPVLISEAHRSR